MQTLQNPISQIVSPNATPGTAKRSQPPTSGTAGDFQRTLNQQIEQRQASRNREQAAAPAAAAARTANPATPQAPAKAPAKETQPTQVDKEQGGNSELPCAPASETAAPATGDRTTAEASMPATTTAPVAPPADPAAEMLALVGSIQLAIEPPAAATAAKEVAELPANASIKADGKNLATERLLAAAQGSGKAAASAATAQAERGDFADSLGQAQGKAATAQGSSVLSGKAEPGKLAIDAQLAASARAGTAVAEPSIKETPADLSRLAAQLQPGALQLAAAAAAVPADKLTGRVGTPAWDQQLGQKVVWMAAGGDQSATLTLNPPDLGPVQVVLTVTNDQADAAFMSAQPEVRQALEAAMPRLREMMSEAGIAFGSATVSAGTPEQQNNGERAASGERRGTGQGERVSGGEIAIAPASRPSLSAVDTFA
ncbi:flagellar hook-length control protein FliK [Janthinobacterium sp. LB2P10]|uniref:flagellar hook-length control protein FliK n=1 Tax=Janthinobacterium sp. LB2P10 TaxID=3424194 RepID=UPI003F1F24A8